MGPLLERDLPIRQPGEPSEFAAFLHRQHLQAIWLKRLGQSDAGNDFAALIECLKDAAKAWATLELPQHRLMNLAHRTLSEAGIDYFFAKGAQLRHVIYDDPMDRSAIDIDVFVKVADRERAVRILERAGFTARGLPETISHEIKLTQHNTDIDLHWHLLRPGRFRPGLMDWLFSRRQRFGEFWGLDDTASLFVMLVHPAITKYLLSPTSMLIHQVDQARLIQRGHVDWDELERVLAWSGARTAAWGSLYVLRELAGLRAPNGIEERLKPGRIHCWYLRQWIDRAWITRWFEKRWLVAGFFSLAMQDSAVDGIRAMRALRKGRSATPAFWNEQPPG